jgi:hypothetical protein
MVTDCCAIFGGVLLLSRECETESLQGVTAVRLVLRNCCLEFLVHCSNGLSIFLEPSQVFPESREITAISRMIRGRTQHIDPNLLVVARGRAHFVTCYKRALGTSLCRLSASSLVRIAPSLRHRLLVPPCVEDAQRKKSWGSSSSRRQPRRSERLYNSERKGG